MSKRRYFVYGFSACVKRNGPMDERAQKKEAHCKEALHRKKKLSRWAWPHPSISMELSSSSAIGS